jgi:hypothetical protein
MSEQIRALYVEPGDRTEPIQANHALTHERIARFQAGSALNAAQGDRT